MFVAPLKSPTIPPATTTNAYVIGTTDLYVVDPATYEESEKARLFEMLDERVADGARVAGVLLTHHHRDHIGAVNDVSSRYDVPVHAHELTLDRIPAGFKRGRALEDGSRIDLGRAPDGSPDWHVEALFTPGHDRGHLAFRESRYRALFAGDLVSTLSTIVIDPPEGHLRTYLASLMRLMSEDIDVLYPAHGAPTTEPKTLLREYVRHRGEREEALVRALRKEPRKPSDLVPEVYEDVDPRMYALAERSLLAGLEKLAEEGRAEEVDAKWKLRA